jgi:polyketide biosynthesis enoyl-CoA hydratase PksH
MRYKRFVNSMDGTLETNKAIALRTNKEVFSNQHNLQGIARYVSTGQFPWE